MAQGTRGHARRLVLAGLGLVVGAGLTGCMDKDEKAIQGQRYPGPGLPGTPQVKGGATPGAGGYAGQPAGNWGTTQPGGNWSGQGGMPAGRGPAAGMQPAGYNSPAAGMGAGGYNPGPYNQGTGAGFGTGAAPAGGVNPLVPSVTPAGGAGYNYNNAGSSAAPLAPSATRAQSPTPDQPALTDIPLPPAAPGTTGPVAVPSLAGPIAPSPVPPAGAGG